MKSLLNTAVIAAALAGLTLAGCTTTSPTGDDTATDETTTTDATVVFECPGGETITAQFIGADEAIVTLPNQDPITLPATEAASGARYSDGTTTLWNKGENVLVEVDNTVVLSDCTAQN
ncbi:MliC family protein [Nodosilinea sp. AN01ver1]|uniref:MliC family protein n=1 Tax=Nodosilinea sp. AN01ver1 TaxID=3423362 RepID=UPI003D30FD29